MRNWKFIEAKPLKSEQLSINVLCVVLTMVWKLFSNYEAISEYLLVAFNDNVTCSFFTYEQ